MNLIRLHFFVYVMPNTYILILFIYLVISSISIHLQFFNSEFSKNTKYAPRYLFFFFAKLVAVNKNIYRKPVFCYVTFKVNDSLNHVIDEDHGNAGGTIHRNNA